MSQLALVALVLAGIVAITPLSERLATPAPVLLTVFGLVLGLVPFLPALDLEPDLILPVVLPPLLFAATQRSTAREFRSQARPIVVLAVGLTVASAGLAAVIAHAAGLAWAPAAVLGAVVAPPDPVAATSVARRLRLPARVVTVLEGEGMFNDATALVMYQLAVAAVVAGHVQPLEIGWRLVLAVGAGVAVGLATGWLTRIVLGVLADDTAQTAVTLAVPFAAYLLAEWVHGSGVLAVLVLGLYLRSYGHRSVSSGGWLLGRAVWRFVDYLITSAVFVMIGLELTDITQASTVDGSDVALAGWVIGALVLGRIAWMFPASALAARWDRRRGGPTSPRYRETTVIAWAGMRGVVSVATALALPLRTTSGEAFPDRTTILLVGLACVLVTLVLQGLTLVPVVTWLGVGVDGDSEGREAVELRRHAAEAGLEVARGLSGDVPRSARRAVVLHYESYLAGQQALTEARQGDPDLKTDGSEVSSLLQRAGEAERDVVLRARATGQVSPEVADEVLTEIEARMVRDVD